MQRLTQIIVFTRRVTVFAHFTDKVFFYNKIQNIAFFLSFAGRVRSGMGLPRDGKSEKNTFFWFKIKFSILVLFLVKSSIFTPLLKIF